jgi:hypothetical protein
LIKAVILVITEHRLGNRLNIVAIALCLPLVKGKERKQKHVGSQWGKTGKYGDTTEFL